MKNMLLRVLAVVVIALGFIGCGTESELEVTVVGTAGVLKVGMCRWDPPFTDADEAGNTIGLLPDISLAFGEYLNKDVEIVLYDFTSLIQALDNGEVDVLIADMAQTNEREVFADFSNPYRYVHTSALVNLDFANANNITSDMLEKDFFAIPDARYASLEGMVGQSYPRLFGLSPVGFPNVASVVAELTVGLRDVYVGGDEVYKHHHAYPDTTMVYTGITLESGARMAVKKGNAELLTHCNNFIATMFADGGFYDDVKETYDPLFNEYYFNDEMGLEYILTP